MFVEIASHSQVPTQALFVPDPFLWADLDIEGLPLGDDIFNNIGEMDVGVDAFDELEGLF